MDTSIHNVIETVHTEQGERINKIKSLKLTTNISVGRPLAEDFCSCFKCVTMPTAEECFCCQSTKYLKPGGNVILAYI